MRLISALARLRLRSSLSLDIAGIVPIVVTPFDAAGQVDVPALHRLVDDYCRNGVTGVVVPAVASEVDKLSEAERAMLVRETVAAAAGRVPVIGGVLGANGLAAAREGEAALAAGAAALLARPPASLIREPASLTDYVREVAATGVGTMVLQDLAWDDFGLEVGLIVKLAEQFPALRAIKIEVVRTGFKASQVLAATQGVLRVWSGWAMLQMLETLARGVDTYNPSAYNRPFVEIAACYQAGDYAAAERRFEQVLPYLAWSRQHIDINLHLLKRYCVRRGLFHTPALRAPAQPYDDHHERYGQILIERMLAWEGRN
jgi:4-hydroxy-tetrahydrodipicolinate synthase